MSSSSDEEEDFSPILPGMAVSSASTEVEKAPLPSVTENSRVGAPPPKQPRLEHAEPVASTTTSSPPAAVGNDGDVPARHSAIEELEQFYDEKLGLPLAPLYERGFQHTSLEDIMEARDLGRHGGEGKAAMAQVLPRTVEDIVALADELGVLLCTVDSAGILRVWRRIPRGIFFLRELPRLFSSKLNHSVISGSGNSKKSDEESSQRAFFSLHVAEAVQWLIAVCVEEEESDVDLQERATREHVGAGGTLTTQLRVHVRQINPVTLTVDARSETSIAIPVLVEAAEEGGSASRSASKGTRLRVTRGYTRRPVLAMHQHLPHIAIFANTLSSTSSSQPLQHGVVLFPCFPSGTASTAHRSFSATRISVVNPVVRATQQQAGRERSGTAPLILVDAKGIIDYVMIDGNSSVVADSTSGLSLKPIAGLAACAPSSADARLWRQWITFERRIRTDCFALVRATQTTAQDEPKKIVPLSVSMSMDGRTFAISSAIVTMKHEEGAESIQVNVLACVHVFDFASAKCVASQCRLLGNVCVTGVSGKNRASALLEDWGRAMEHRARSLSTSCVLHSAPLLTSTSAATHSLEFLLYVPQVHLDEILSLPGVTRDDRPPPFVPGEWSQGRQVVPIAISLKQKLMSDLPRSVGEWEHLLSEKTKGEGSVPDIHLHSSSGVQHRTVTLADMQQSLHSSFTSYSHTAVVLLSQPVAASQDLRNSVSHSPLGSTLSSDAIKQLFLSEVGAPVEMLFTTSASTPPTSMVMYSARLPAAGYEAKRLLTAVKPNEDKEENRNATSDESALALQWPTVLHDLQRSREFSCGELLAAALPVESSSSSAPLPHHASGEVNVALGAPPCSPSASEVPAAATAEKAQQSSTKSPSDAEIEQVGHLLRHVALPPPPLALANVKTALIHVRQYGTIRVSFLSRIAPRTVENFVLHSRKHFYNGLSFHRVIGGAMVQGGCPRGDGTGGSSAFAGQEFFDDENLQAFPFFSYMAQHSWLCMANCGPNTNGSQFFLTVRGGTAMPWLNHQHTVFGFVTDGFDVVETMSHAPTNEEDKPQRPIVMERVDIL